MTLSLGLRSDFGILHLDWIAVEDDFLFHHHFVQLVEPFFGVAHSDLVNYLLDFLSHWIRLV
jgi:hypothetical protein